MPHGYTVAKGNGKPRMRKVFLNWLSGKEPNVPPVTYAQVRRAVDRARARDQMRFAVLDWRMQPSGPDKPTSVAFCDAKKITATTLGRWFYKGVELVVEELIAELNGMR